MREDEEALRGTSHKQDVVVVQGEGRKGHSVHCEIVFREKVYLVMLKHRHDVNSLVLLNGALCLLSIVFPCNYHIRAYPVAFIWLLADISEIAPEEIHVRSGNHAGLSNLSKTLQAFFSQHLELIMRVIFEFCLLLQRLIHLDSYEYTCLSECNGRTIQPRFEVLSESVLLDKLHLHLPLLIVPIVEAEPPHAGLVIENKELIRFSARLHGK